MQLQYMLHCIKPCVVLNTLAFVVMKSLNPCAHSRSTSIAIATVYMHVYIVMFIYVCILVIMQVLSNKCTCRHAYLQVLLQQ